VPRYELPPAATYVYHQVMIDLGRCLAIHRGGGNTPLEGQVFGLLTLLLDHPGRVITYRQLARALMPAYARQRNQRSGDLDPQQQEAIKRAMQTLVYRTRIALAEQPGMPSIIINRETIGYAIQRPLRIITGDAPDDSTVPETDMQPAPAKWPVSARERK